MAYRSIVHANWRAKSKILFQQIRSLHLHEYQSQKLLSDFTIPVPRGEIAHSPKDVRRIIDEFSSTCVIKPQILEVNHDKRIFNGILNDGSQFADTGAVGEALASKMFNSRSKVNQIKADEILVNKVYVTELTQYDEEWYLALALDRENYTPVINISRKSLENAKTNERCSGELHSFPYTLTGGITPDLLTQISKQINASAEETRSLGDILAKLHELFVSKDAIMLEINTLALNPDATFQCGNSNFMFDDASERRQKDLFALKDIKAEVIGESEAHKYGLVYIKMDGNIGNVVNGAGLAMATNDAIADHGGASANFLDTGGQATKETMQKAFEIILRDDRIKVILVNIYGGIIKCDMIAESIINAARELGPLRIPLVVRLQGTNSAEGLEILEKADLGFHVESDFGEAAKKSVELAGLS